MARLLELCIFWFGMLLVPAVGYLMLVLGAADPVMVTLLGVGVVVAYIGLNTLLGLQKRNRVDSLNDSFEAALTSSTHEELRDNLKALLSKTEESGWAERSNDTAIRKDGSASEITQSLRKCLELTETAIDYKESRQADSDMLRRLKLDLPNLEIQMRSMGWGNGDASIARREYIARFQYLFSFAAALRIWSGVAFPMIIITWLFEATSVLQAQRNPAEVYTLWYYSGASLVSLIISRILGWR